MKIKKKELNIPNNVIEKYRFVSTMEALGYKNHISFIDHEDEEMWNKDSFSNWLDYTMNTWLELAHDLCVLTMQEKLYGLFDMNQIRKALDYAYQLARLKKSLEELWSQM